MISQGLLNVIDDAFFAPTLDLRPAMKKLIFSDFDGLALDAPSRGAESVIARQAPSLLEPLCSLNIRPLRPSTNELSKGPQNFTVEEDRIEHVKSAYELTTDKKFNLTQGSTSLTFADQKVSLNAAGAVHVKRGPAEVTIDQSGKVVVSSPSGISLQCGSSKLELLPSGVEINGMKVACTAGASSLELGPASAKLSGPMSSVEGTATCSVKGLMVNVNS